MKYSLIQFLCSYLSGKLYLLRVKSRVWRFFPTLHNHYFRSWHILIYYRFVMNCFCNDIRTRWLMLREAHEELWTQCGDELVSVGAFIHYRPSVLCRRWWWRVCRWRHSAVGCKNPPLRRPLPLTVFFHGTSFVGQNCGSLCFEQSFVGVLKCVKSKPPRVYPLHYICLLPECSVVWFFLTLPTGA